MTKATNPVGATLLSPRGMGGQECPPHRCSTRFIPVLLLLLIVLALAPACTKPAAPPAKDCGQVAIGGLESAPAPAGEKAEDGDTLVRRLDAEPPNLNPVITNDIPSMDVGFYLFDTLLDIDLQTGALKPMLASSYEVGPDKVTFTFHLRPDVTFHDGKPMTAADVIFTLDRVLDPKVDAASLRSYFSDCDSYRKLDDYTVEVKWKKPYFKALDMIGGLPVLPKHLLDGVDLNQAPYNRAPVGTGAYRFGEWKTGEEIKLERYPGYYGTRPHFNRVTFKIITNDDSALMVLKKGELNFIERLTRVQWLKQTNSPDFTEHFNKVHYDYPSYSYIGWNLRKPLFQDQRVRRALTLLNNRPAMLRDVFYCMGTIQAGPMYAKSQYADPTLQPLPFDPERAKQLLAEAGWKDKNAEGVLTKDGVPFRFELSFTAAVPEWEQMAVMYQQDLKKAGIEMVIKKLEWAVFLENVQDWKFDACAMAWGLDHNPDEYQLWHSSQADVKASSNHVGFKSAEVDRLIELNRQEFDVNKRIEYNRAIDRIIQDEQPYTFFLSGQHLSAVDKRIHNVLPKPIRPCLNYNEWYVPQKTKAAPAP
jgi:peptide/nickel transport system substrate-binding protein